MVLGKKSFGNPTEKETPDSPEEKEYKHGDMDLPEELENEMRKDTPIGEIDHKEISEIKEREKEPIEDTDFDEERDLDANKFAEKE
jgi:hypothetical protein